MLPEINLCSASTTKIVAPSFVPGAKAELSCKPATLPANNSFLPRVNFLCFFIF